MKKVIVVAALAALAATPALAADMLVKKAPPPPPAPAWSWTGFYVGANAGGGWASTNWFEDVSESGSGGAAPPGFEDASVHASGLLGGGQIGYDWQNGWTIFGIQTDADAAGLRGASSCFPQITGLVFGGVTIAPQSCSTKINAMGTATGRLGAAFDRSLYYVQPLAPGSNMPSVQNGRSFCSTIIWRSANERWCSSPTLLNLHLPKSFARIFR